MSERDALARVLTRVERPGRYVGGEWNEIRKDPARVRTKVALAFPDVYEIGMSYLGQKILYALLNKGRDVLAEHLAGVFHIQIDPRQRRQALFIIFEGELFGGLEPLR